MTRRNKIEGEDFREHRTIGPELLKDTTFIRCNFSGCYFGNKRGNNAKINFRELNASFIECRFGGANFKGVERGSQFAAFKACFDLIDATHLSGKVRKSQRDSPYARSPEVLKRYESPGCTNKSVKPSTQRSLLSFFNRAEEALSSHPELEVNLSP